MLPDFAMLLVGANMGVQLMTKEHISIACALQIPIVVVLTKVDIAPQVTHITHTSSFRPLSWSMKKLFCVLDSGSR